MFGPPSARVTERARLAGGDLDVKGAPRTVRTFEQMALPNRSRNSKERAARIQAVVEPWLDDNS